MSSNEVQNIGLRLAEEINKLGGPTKVAKNLDISKSTIYNWQDKGTVTADKLSQLSSLGADVGYILTGLKMGVVGTAHEEFIQITHYDIAASAGNGHKNYDENIIGTLAFKKEWLLRKGLKADNISVISVHGDSMSPILNDGDIVLVNHEQRVLQSGKAYVLRIADEVLVKYIQKLPDGSVQISSANPQYQPYVLDKHQLEQVDIIGSVVISTHEW